MDDNPAREVNLLEYWALLQRRRWVIYLAVLSSVLVALVGSFIATPLYHATVTLQIERENPDILTFREVGSVDSSWSAYSDFYQTQYQILSSDSVTRLAAQRLDLLSHPLFQSQEDQPGLLARLRSLIPSSSTDVEMTEEDLATAWVQSGLEIAPVKNSHLVNVSWVSPDPGLAAKVANAVGEAYIRFNIESNYNTTDQATEFLVNQIGTLKREIAAIEEELQEYGESKRIVSIDDNNNITLNALSDIARRRTEAQTELAEKNAAYRAAVDAPPDALPEVLNSSLIARLKQEYAAYEADYSEKTKQFKDDWPGMKTLRSKLDQAKQRLDLETEEISRKVIASAEADYQKALNEVRNLDSLLRNQEAAAQTLKRDVHEYSNLQAEADKKRETLNALLTRQNEMALSTRLKELDATSTNVRIVDRARPPTAPFRPNKKLNLFLGLVFGLLAGVALAFLLDHLDNTLHTPGEVEKLSGLPTLALIPTHGDSSAPLSRARRGQASPPLQTVDLVAHREGRASASEAYREMRTALLLSNPGHPPRRIMITSALPEDGKSATAMNLSVVLAQMGRKVLLVDTDLRRPRLREVFGVRADRGVSTCLSGLAEDPLTLVVETGIENLHLLPSGPIPPNPSELLNSPLFSGMGSLFIDAGYDHVIFDSPPALSVADPIIIASVVDAAILVVRANRTPRESLRLAVDKFQQAGIRPIGVVVNDLALERRYSAYRYYRTYHQDPKGSSQDAGHGKPEADGGNRARGARGV